MNGHFSNRKTKSKSVLKRSKCAAWVGNPGTRTLLNRFYCASFICWSFIRINLAIKKARVPFYHHPFLLVTGVEKNPAVGLSTHSAHYLHQSTFSEPVVLSEKKNACLPRPYLFSNVHLILFSS